MDKQQEYLIQDLYSRLPYGIVVHIDPHELNDGYCDIDTVKLYPKDADKLYRIIERGVTVKPYLFPMSSMTEEQEKYFALLQTESIQCDWLYPSHCANLMRFIYENHLDYENLIGKGKAVDATDKNVY
jgi:hypothetical protein